MTYVRERGKKLFDRICQDSDIFRSILKSILVIVPVPVVIIAIVAIVSSHLLETTVDEFRLQTMERIMSEVEHNFEFVTLAMVQANNNQTIFDYARQKERDYYEESQVVKALNKITAGYSNIEEIYLYLPQFDKVFSSLHGMSSEAWYKRNYAAVSEGWLLRTGESRRWNFHIVQGMDGEGKNILSAHIGNYHAQLMVQMDNDYLKKILEQLCFYKEEESFLISRNGVALTTFTGEEGNRLEDLVLQSLEDKIDRIRFNDRVYELSSIVSPGKGLVLVTAVPTGSNHISVLYFRIAQFFLLVICIILFCVLAYVAASRNYAPIKKINYLMEEFNHASKIRDYEDMESYVRTSSSDIRELQKRVVQHEEDMRKLHIDRILFRGAGVSCENALHEVLRGQFFGVLLCIIEKREDTEEEMLINQSQDSVLSDILYAYAREYLPVPDQICVREENEKQYCVLNGDMLEEFERIPESCLLLKRTLSDRENIYCDFYVSSVYEELEDLHKGYEEVNKKWEAAESQSMKENDAEDIFNADKIQELIQENISNPELSANGIADMLKITPWQLSRLFKAKMNIGVLEYIHLCRIERAKNILKSKKELRVKEVADSVGFCNVATFIRVFKKLTGVTPGQYREVIGLDSK